jgi:hypothetical protein
VAVEMSERTVLYRLFTAEGTLLYIGISSRVEYRICCEHLVNKDWFKLVERATFEHFDLRWRAEMAEIKAIQREVPLYNVAHNEMPYSQRDDAFGVLRQRVERKRAKTEEEIEYAD